MTDAPPPSPARNPLGWIALGLLFAYMMFGAVSRPTSDRPGDRIARYTSRLQTALANYEAGDNPATRVLTGKNSDEPLRKLERDLEPKRRTETIEAGFWAVVRRHLGEPVTEADLRPLTRDRDYALLAQANRAVRRTPAEALALAAKLDERGAASRLAAEHVRQEAGIEKKAAPTPNARKLVGGALLLALLPASALAWIFLFATGGSGALRWPGPAMEVRSKGEADEMALRAAILFTAFLALSIVASLLLVPFVGRLGAQAVAFGAMLAVVPLTLRAKPGLAAVGLAKADLLKNVGLGLWFFLLELPVTGGVALVCSRLLSNLPQPEHPASTTLLGSPDVLTVAVTLFTGAIVAPIWEETAFRGLLFPALRKLLGGPIPAALISSFLFASIHPQGPVLWAALASVALFSCFLAQKSRSLVPSIVMHMAHNATLLVLTILIGG